MRALLQRISRGGYRRQPGNQRGNSEIGPRSSARRRAPFARPAPVSCFGSAKRCIP